MSDDADDQPPSLGQKLLRIGVKVLIWLAVIAVVFVLMSWLVMASCKLMWRRPPRYGMTESLQARIWVAPIRAETNYFLPTER